MRGGGGGGNAELALMGSASFLPTDPGGMVKVIVPQGLVGQMTDPHMSTSDVPCPASLSVIRTATGSTCQLFDTVSSFNACQMREAGRRERDARREHTIRRKGERGHGENGRWMETGRREKGEETGDQRDEKRKQVWGEQDGEEARGEGNRRKRYGEKTKGREK